MSISPGWWWRACLAVCVVLGVLRSPAAGCVGDCNEDGKVGVDEVVLCVDIGLGKNPIADCPMLDEDENQEGSIVELIGAVGSLLEGCEQTPTPTGTSTPTATITPTATPTPTPTLNLPPVLPSLPIYRTYPDFAVAVPLFLEDPNGDPVQCSSESLPDGAGINEDGHFEWTPDAGQVGPFYVPYSCTDGASLPTEGNLTLKVQPLDTCVTPTCDPASGCTDSLPPLSEACCTEGPAARIAEPQADCPEHDGEVRVDSRRVIFSGRNQRGFGRLQNCDKLRLLVQTQAGAVVRFNIETRCMNTNNRVTIRARMETASPIHTLAFDFQANLFLERDEDGFDRFYSLSSAIDGSGPFFDLDEVEANLTVWARDSDGNEATNTTRVILTRDVLPELPDLDATPTPQ